MKLNEVIELNGKEYTVELNRESAVKIEQYVNMAEILEKINQPLYLDKSNKEILDNEDPFADIMSDEEVMKISEEKDNALIKAYSRAFWIWLYPVEKLKLKEVEELLLPYMQDEVKAIYINNKYEEFTKKSIELRENYLKELKNLKAQAK